jgi:hypothetical protein
MKKTFLLLCFLPFVTIHAQWREGYNDSIRIKLYKLDDAVGKGDYKALELTGQYLDDTSYVQEFLGYHNYPNTARGVAMRILQENTLFSKEEMALDSSLTAAVFSRFLQAHSVHFDTLSGTFLHTGLSKRTTVYQLKELSEYDIKQVNKTTLQKPYPAWFPYYNIERLLSKKDPEVLLQIASAWYNHRSKFNSYYFQEEEFKDLIRRLTHAELGVPDEDGVITFLYENDYYAQAKLNFLIYWANHYRDYQWDTGKGFFINTKEQAPVKTAAEKLFPILQSKKDAEAKAAFVALTEMDTGTIRRMSRDYEQISIGGANYSLPTFTFRFLPVLATLTQYCRDNNISYKSSGWLKDSLAKLGKEISFKDRYRLEDSIIQRLTLKEITMVEYEALIEERAWQGTYSMGRMLDKWYSLHMKEIEDDPQQLALYLKKAAIFNELGIIGINRKYLFKLSNAGEERMLKVKQLNEWVADADIKTAIAGVVALQAAWKPDTLEKPSIWDGNNFEYGVPELEKEYNALKTKFPKNKDRENEVEQLLGRISYNQISAALALLLNDKGLDTYSRFHFLKSDFGLEINSYETAAIRKLMDDHTRLTEQELYKQTVKQSGMNCLDKKDQLLYSVVYDILKYDVVDAFAGGGGGRRDDYVYAVIKLLELQLGTKLGYPPKKCSWKGMNYCDSGDRGLAWMQYLEEKGLVKVDKTIPLSISHNR